MLMETFIDKVSPSTVKIQCVRSKTKRNNKLVKEINSEWGTELNLRYGCGGREYKQHRDKFDTAERFVAWYNNRIHGALDLEIGETPQEAFIRKLRQECLCGMFWKRIERWST